ncbi:uncharacterized protein LOC111875895 [Lactuca sativa]|uniref:uncharacterized protein LOC111875895 n=1 Tax=Lactuca sativa TaxID=4236 RepID=UPI000CD943F2|nr:uncharacterized protein LOC111875895 [Lactuca sativa]
MNRAQNKAYWNTYVSKKKQKKNSSKKSKKKKSLSVKTKSQNPFFGEKKSMSKPSKSQKDFSKDKEHVLKPNQKSNVQTSYHENYVKSQQKVFVKNSNNQRIVLLNMFQQESQQETLRNSKLKGREMNLSRLGKRFHSGKFSQEQIKDVYEKYLNESSNESSSQKESNPSVKKWRTISKENVSKKETKKNEEKVNVNFKSSNDYISIPLNNDVDLIDNVKTKVLCDEQYDKKNAYEQVKHHRQGYPIVIDSKIVKPLELLHIDLCGSSTVETLYNKRYILVIVDDFSRFTWVYFLRLKSETTQVMIDFIKQIELSLKKKVCKIKSDNGSEFKNKVLDSFLADKGSENDEPFEDAPLDFDPTYPPLDR